MQVEDMIFISVDDHVVEPPHMFDGRLPAKLADRAPRIEHTDAGDDVWVFDHQVIPNIGLNAVAGRPKSEYGVNPTAFDEMRAGCYDVNERVKDMSAGGVLACMCFPSFPSFSGRLFLSCPDKQLALAVVQAYNDWHIDEWCGTHPGRFIPMALPVLWDPELSAAEVRRVAKKGCHSLTFTENPATLGLPSFHDSHWDPLWRALAEEGTVLNIHLGSSGQLTVTAPDAPIDVMITLQPINICQAAADLVWSRVFKEFPTLRVALSEGGTGWIPYFLDRLDRTYDMHHTWTGQDFGDRLPSDIFREHFLTCFIADPVGLRLRDDIGIDNICWEQDYPHSDSSWPKAPEELAKVAARYGVTDAEIAKITHENAMRWYRFDPFAHRTREQCTVGALRAEVPDHDVAVRAMDKGRFAGVPTMTLGELAERDGVMTKSPELRDDYSGPFDPGVGLGDFSRRALARLGREYLLHGHLQDRVGIPLVLGAHSRQDMLDVAIEEWMAASPLYSLRTQRALDFGNADVPTIFKNIQLDIGAPHQFMDFRYKVDDPQHGEFWLDHCGALMDVEPMGEEFVQGMCHDIEDPTFDATAGATNPYAQVRPIHRPPRVPTDRAPHCHWRVVIDPEHGEPVEPHPTMAIIGKSEIARIMIDDPGRDAEPGGWYDYSGEFDPDFTLEDLSHRALVVALQEVAVQTHLLAHAYLYCVASRWGVDEARANAPQVFAGTAGVSAGRLPGVLGITGDDAEAIAKLLQLHPAFMPRTYVAPVIDVIDDLTVRFALDDAPCFRERDDLSWPASMTAGPSTALDAIARAINPRASSTPDPTRGRERHAWRITIDPSAAPAVLSPSVALASISTGATVTFLPRRDLRK